MMGKTGAVARRRSTLVALVAAMFALPLFFSSSASAIDGYFCGTPSSPRAIGAGGECIGTAYHSNFVAMSANAVTGPRACVGRSSAPGSWLGLNLECNGTASSSTWTCTSAPCPGYGAILNRSTPGGTYYGWYSYR